MELICLNEAYESVGVLPYINLQWNRRYIECGDFSAQIRMRDYIQDARYVYTRDRPEMGILEKIHTDTDITGEYVQLTGRFLESMLSRDIVFPSFNQKGRPSKLAHTLVKKYAEDIPGLLIEDYAEDSAEEETECEYRGDDLDEVTWKLLQMTEKSQAIHFDFATSRLTYRIWQGKDRTQKQSANSFAVFSDQSGNTDRISIDEDESGYRNYAVISLDDEDDGKFITVDLRDPPDEPRRILFLDESGSEEKKDVLRQKAKEELQKWPKLVNVEAAAIQQGIFYLRDYDLGDVCDIVSTRMNRRWERRIIEVNEVFKEGQHTVELVFGDRIPTLYERMG